MENLKPNTWIVQLLNQFADIEQRLCDVSIAVAAQRLALQDAVPDFASKYRAHLVGTEVSALKSEFEHRIHSLRTSADKIQNS